MIISGIAVKKYIKIWLHFKFYLKKEITFKMNLSIKARKTCWVLEISFCFYSLLNSIEKTSLGNGLLS